MNADTSQPDERFDTKVGVRRWLLQILIFILLLAASLFISSGRLDWVMGWVYLGLFAAGQAITALVLVPRDPELLTERAQIKDDVKGWDRPLVGFVTLFGPLSIWIVSGLDLRFNWSGQMPPAFWIAALPIAVLGSLLTTWSMASNAFFSGVVRIQQERGQTVATGGPYQFVRHPGYLGGILFDLATPLILNSLWAIVPAVLTVCALVIRTTLEDRTLQEELDGYREYARRVRYRLLPGVW
jgi:protein-S-isoprenylcysteine O-methyltransferase Ste14